MRPRSRLAGRSLGGLILVVTLAACSSSALSDADSDGYADSLDCAPDDRSINPGAEDRYGDGVDQDCDGGDGVDIDGDGYPSNVPLDPEFGDLQDCDDGDPAVHPGVEDTVGDGLDQNCDGADGVDSDGDGHASVDSGGDDCDDDDYFTWPGANDYVGDGADQSCDGVDGLDVDGDGHASVATLGDDCDDDDSAIHPGASESCDGIDSDCVDDPDELDADGDGHLVCGGDCDDGDPSIHPGAVEECNDIDQDCNGSLPAQDHDGDGLAPCEGDCDDNDSATFPGASERCNGLDDDCDGLVPAAEADADSDGWVACVGDCDDGDPDTFPGQWFETPGDGTDSDCDGQDAAVLLGGASVVFQGSSAANIFGGAVAPAGDVDGDGLADVLIAAPGSNTTGSGAYTAGRTLLFTGAQLSAPRSTPLTLGDARARLQGEGSLDFSGTSMTGVGDVDGDGLGDIVIGAFANDDAGQNAGAVYLVLGSAIAAGGTFDLGSPSVSAHVWTGEGTGDELGISVAAAGDVDGDGLADFLFGAHNALGYAGRAYLVLSGSLPAPGTHSASSVTHKLDGEGAGEFAGTSVAGAGDVDGDGLADLLVGAPSADGQGFGAGRAYLWLGSSLASPGARDLGDAAVIFEGVANNEQAGEVVRFADDMDGDGRSEILVGNVSGGAGFRLFRSSTMPMTGTVSLSSAPHHFPGVIPGPSGTVSDVDGDGLTDLLVGYPELGSAGGARLFLGASLGPSGEHDPGDADFSWDGSASGDAAGFMVAGVGDVDGDGRDDLLVGTHRPGTSAIVGEAYLLLSPY